MSPIVCQTAGRFQSKKLATYESVERILSHPWPTVFNIVLCLLTQRTRLDTGEQESEEYDSEDDGVLLNGLIFGERLGEVLCLQALDVLSLIRLSLGRVCQVSCTLGKKKRNPVFVVQSSACPSDTCEKKENTAKFRMRSFLLLCSLIPEEMHSFVNEQEGPPTMKMVTALDKVYTEIDIQKDLWHANVVPLLAVIDDADQDPLYIIVEYMPGGAVMTWNEKKEVYANTKFQPSIFGGLPLNIVRAVALGTLRGLKYLHSLGIIHRVIQSSSGF